MPDETSVSTLEAPAGDPSALSEDTANLTGEETSTESPASTTSTDPALLERLQAAEAAAQQLKQQLDAYNPIIERVTAEEEQRQIQELVERYRPLVEAPDVDPQVRGEFGSILKDALEFRQQRPAIQQERSAAAALNYAATIISIDPTMKAAIDAWKAVAKDLYDLGDPNAMAKIVPVLSERWQERQRNRIGTNAAARIESGADAPPPMSGPSAGALSVDAIEEKLASNRGRVSVLTAAEKSRYAEYRRSQGLPLFPGLT